MTGTLAVVFMVVLALAPAPARAADAPAWIDDGPGADIDSTGDGSVVEANWAAVADVLRYEYCISTSVGCGGIVAFSWTSNGTSTSLSRATALVDGETYYSCVRVVDTSGVLSAVQCSDGYIYSTNLPPTPAQVDDGTGTDIDWTASADTIDANWSTEAGIASYEYCVSVAGPCPTAYPDGMIGYWPLDGDGTDRSGNGNTVELGTGAAAPTWGEGYAGQGLVFDGVDDWARAPWAPSLQTDAAITMTAWIRKVDTSTAVPIVEYNDGTTTGVIMINASTGTNLRLNAKDTSNGNHSVTSPNNVVSAGSWHHVAVTYDGSFGRVYYDGVQVASSSLGSFSLKTTAGYDLYIGHRPSNGLTFRGTIDDVRIYGRALNGAEITAEYGAGIALRDWTDVALATSVSASGLTLANGSRYMTCVRTIASFGVKSPSACSDGQRSDQVAPSSPTARDGTGADIDFTASTDTIELNWATSTDALSGLSGYEYCISTAATCAGTVLVGWTPTAATTATESGLALAAGTTYYSCVRAADNVGNTVTACTDGIEPDATVPPAPASVADGTGADISWTPSTMQLSANWPGVVDPGSGVDRYEYCFATSVDCSTGVIAGWTSVGTATTATATGLALIEGATYHACVRVVDGVGNVSTPPRCSDGQLVDSLPPPATTSVGDGTGADIDLSTSATVLSANWAAVGGLSHYELCLSTGTGCTGVTALTWTDVGIGTSYTSGVLALTEGATYYACVRVVGINTTYEPATCSDGQQVDAAPPSAAAVRDGTGADRDWTTSSTTLQANWPAATDVASGVVGYEYCLSTATSCGGTLLVGWTANGLVRSFTEAGLPLVDGQEYFACVRTTDGAGHASVGCSDGIRVDLTPPGTIATVDDGPGADIDFTPTGSQLQANWSAAAESGSGLQRYEYCISTAVPCSGTVIASWTSTGTTRSFSRTGLSLTGGQDYFACVRAFDVAGLQTVATTCSDGVQPDVAPPSDPSPVNDGSGADRDWVNSTTTFDANWSASTDAGSGLRRYRYCLSTGTDCGGVVAQGWTYTTATSVSMAGLSLSESARYYVCVRAYDWSDNYVLACSDGAYVDTTPPTGVPWVRDGLFSDRGGTAVDTEISANWGLGSDGGSGLDRYEYCVTTSIPSCDTVAWTSAGLAQSMTHTGLALVLGTTYYTCVRVVDVSGNTSLATCSTGLAIVVPGGGPAWVADGPDPYPADLSWVPSATTLQANWDVVGSAVDYQYCVATVRDCVAGVEVPWTSNGLGLVMTHGGLSLTDGTTYYTCVRADKGAGQITGMTCSDGQMVDATPPTQPTPVIDGIGTDITWTTSASALQLDWGVSTDALSGLSHYEYCLSTAVPCAGTVVSTWTSTGQSTSGTRTGLTLVDGTAYLGCVRAVDVAGAVSLPVCSDGVGVDLSPPALPASVNDGTGADVTYVASATTVSANWPTATDAFSGLDRHEYCISTAQPCSGTVVANWTSVGTATSVTRTGLSLVDGQSYYVCIRARDVAGNLTAGNTCSDGQVVDVSGPGTTTVADGAGADVDETQVTTSYDGNWTSVLDAGAGFDRFERCVSTTLACSGTILSGWTDVGAGTTVSLGALSLVHGTTYYTCVRAYDVLGNVTNACSDGMVVDTTAPPVPTTVDDGTGADVDFFNSLTSVSSNWSVVVDPASGLNRYEICVGTTTVNCSELGWTSTGTTPSATLTGLSLTEGFLYYACVRTWDNAGHVSASTTCSDGQVADVTVPTPPNPAQDSLGADIDLVASSTQLAANWGASTDVMAGLDRYEYCLSTAMSCSGTVVRSWTSTASAQSVTATGLTLVNGVTYFACARAVDGADNPSTLECSDGVVVDVAPPPVTSVADGSGPDVDFVASTTTLSASWSAVTDAISGTDHYELCISTVVTCGGTVVVPWTDTGLGTSNTSVGLTLVDGTTYYACVRSFDTLGNSSIGCSDGQEVDVTAPLAPSPIWDGYGADQAFTNSQTQVPANWAASSDPGGSGVAGYEMCVSSTPGGDCSVAALADVGLLIAAARSGLSLTEGQLVYACVRAYDAVGNSSPVGCSNGQTIDATPPPLPAEVRGGPAGDDPWTYGDTTLSANWDAVVDGGSGLERYEYCFSTGTDCSGTVVEDWTGVGTATTATAYGLTLVAGTTYYACVRTYDVATNVSTSTRCSAGQVKRDLRIASITPASGPQGREGLLVTLSGLEFAAGAVASISGAGITIVNQARLDPSTIELELDIALGAPTGARDVTVTNLDTSTTTSSNGFTVTTPSISVAVSALGYASASRDTSATPMVDFGSASMDGVVEIGPAGSGQAMASQAALEFDISTDVDWTLTGSAADWTGPAPMPATTLAWRQHGTADPWTAFTTSSSTIMSAGTIGNQLAALDLQWTVPAGQLAGDYSTSTVWTVVPQP